MQSVSQKSAADAVSFWQDLSLLGPVPPHLQAPLMQSEIFEQLELPLVIPPDVAEPDVPEPDVPEPEPPEEVLSLLLLHPKVPNTRVAAARARTDALSVIIGGG